MRRRCTYFAICSACVLLLAACYSHFEPILSSPPPSGALLGEWKLTPHGADCLRRLAGFTATTCGFILRNDGSFVSTNLPLRGIRQREQKVFGSTGEFWYARSGNGSWSSISADVVLLFADGLSLDFNIRRSGSRYVLTHDLSDPDSDEKIEFMHESLGSL